MFQVHGLTRPLFRLLSKPMTYAFYGTFGITSFFVGSTIDFNQHTYDDGINEYTVIVTTTTSKTPSVKIGNPNGRQTIPTRTGEPNSTKNQHTPINTTEPHKFSPPNSKKSDSPSKPPVEPTSTPTPTPEASSPELNSSTTAEVPIEVPIEVPTEVTTEIDTEIPK